MSISTSVIVLLNIVSTFKLPLIYASPKTCNDVLDKSVNCAKPDRSAPESSYPILVATKLLVVIVLVTSNSPPILVSTNPTLPSLLI